MWLSGLQRYFPVSIQMRGAGYARKVRIVESDDQMIHAHVRGNEDYCLRLELHDRRLSASCSCPYFESAGPCKHLWALLEHARDTGAFGGAEAPESLNELPARPNEPLSSPRAMVAPPRRGSHEPSWRRDLSTLRTEPAPAATSLEPGAEIVYLLDVQASLLGRGAHLEMAMRTRKRDGEWSRPRVLSLPAAAVTKLADPADRELVPILSSIAGTRDYSPYMQTVATRVVLAHGSAATLLAKVFATDRVQLRISAQGKNELLPCGWDDGPPYRFHLVVVPTDDRAHLVVRGEFRRDGERRPLQDRVIVLPDGLVVFRERAAHLEITPAGFRRIVLLLARDGELRVPAEDGDALAVELRSLPDGPPIDLPEPLRVEERRGTPLCCLRLRSPSRDAYSDNITGELRFDYDGLVAEDTDTRPQLPIPDQRAVLVRDLALERAARDRLTSLSMRRLPSYPDAQLRWTVSPKRLGDVAATLGAEGWRVEADGKLFRAPGTVSIAVTSGIDWFDLSNCETSLHLVVRRSFSSATTTGSSARSSTLSRKAPGSA